MKARLHELYEDKIRAGLQKDLSLSNVMSVPYIKKIVLSMGGKDVVADTKLVNALCDELMLITGQKPIITKAKKSIAGFKLRKGVVMGCKVTLRKRMMYEFLDRLVNIALPRVRDFRGFNADQFDNNGNFCFGLKEQTVFPESDYDKVDKIRGMNIVIVTSSHNDAHAKSLLEKFDVPFVN